MTNCCDAVLPGFQDAQHVVEGRAPGRSGHSRKTMAHDDALPDEMGAQVVGKRNVF